MNNITFFSSPIGLGHATRDIAVCKQIKNFSIKFVSGDAAANLIKKSGFKVDDVYVAPKFDYQHGVLQNSLKWIFRYYKYYKNCQKISSKIISEQKPKIIVSDEDFAALTIAQKQKIPTVLITDILETRFTKGFSSLIEKKMNHSMQKIIQKCDIVILPENGSDQDNIRRVGPIVRSTNFSREELREKFSFNKKTVVVSIGGTDAGKFLIEKTIHAFSKINDAELVIVSGPKLDNNYSENLKNLGFVENLHEIIFASDLIVSLAGKSTIDEAKAYGTPGIFIPLKDHFEQEDNAKDEGFSFQDIYRLDSLISEKLNEKRNPVNCDGANKACKIIENLLTK